MKPRYIGLIGFTLSVGVPYFLGFALLAVALDWWEGFAWLLAATTACVILFGTLTIVANREGWVE